MKNYLYLFYRWPGAEKKLFFRAVLQISYYLAILQILSGKKIQKYFGKLIEMPPEMQDSIDTDYIYQVKRSIYRAIRFLRLENKCLAYALAAKKLLLRRKIPCLLYLGFAKKDDKLTAHAWLISADKNIVGAEAREAYKVIAIFSSE